MIATETLPAWVAAYIGIPFKDRGRTREGCNCWSLVGIVYREVFNVSLPSYEARYESLRDRVAIARLFFEEATSQRWHRVAPEMMRVPDVLSLTVVGASHVGVLVAPGRMLHVLPGRETCVERLHPHWAPRIDGIYRHEALAGGY